VNSPLTENDYPLEPEEILALPKPEEILALPKRSHKKKGFIPGTREVFQRLQGEPEVRRPRVGKGSGRAGGARAATHARSHRKYYPGTTPENCYACQHGWRAASRLQQKEFFDPSEDKILRAYEFSDLPKDLQIRFGEPLNYKEFINRWKSLRDRIKYRFIRFCLYSERQWRQKEAREQAEKLRREQWWQEEMKDVEI